MAIASAQPLLVFAALLGACVWIGGFIALAIVAWVARRELERPQMVKFFRSFGRRYAIVGSAGLVLGLGAGGALLGERRFDGLALAAVLLAAAIVLALALGIVQARGMTRLRRRLLAAPDDAPLGARVRRGAIQAGLTRTALGVLSFALLAVSAVLASTRT